MRYKTEKRILLLGITFSVLFLWIIFEFFKATAEPPSIDVGLKYQTVSFSCSSGDGYIYDRNMNPLVNESYKYVSAAVPEMVGSELIEYAKNRNEFNKGYNSGELFVFECRSDTPESEGVTVFKIPQRYSEEQTACHVIGYTSQGTGVDGIEAAYDSILRCEGIDQCVSYPADGFGNIMRGLDKTVIHPEENKSGVVLTLDKRIQKICEKASLDIEKGAIVVTEISSGDILAMVSVPTYDVNNIADALDDESSPMINRCLYSYSVGSIFKLVTAAEAINENHDMMMWNCEGAVDVNGKNFRCHRLDGHGVQNIVDAMVNSCNTYFINISKFFSAAKFRETAYELGFGREIHLCSGMTASAGVLPSVKELSIPAELANFSFGQGKLSATPLHISQLTCAVANGGKMPVLRLIRGMTSDGEIVENEKSPNYAYAMDESTAESLKNMMISAVYNNENSKATPKKTTAGAKTSTAQTGRYDNIGNEIYNAWITGFFPSDDPQYAITVLVENGGYGNDSAAPIFKKIADSISEYSD